MMRANLTLSVFGALRIIAVVAALLVLPVAAPGGSGAAWACNCKDCCSAIGECSSTCVCTSNKQTKITTDHIVESFKQHREWMINVFFMDDRKGDQSNFHTVPGMLAALQTMTSQLTASTVSQIQTIGMMLDAKHQMETQRLFQQLTAEAHRDYQPSEGLCAVGTMTRSLAASARHADLTHVTLAGRMNERQLLSGDNVTTNSAESDFWSRLKQFRATFCNPRDNGNGLANLCKDGGTDKTRFNRDVDYTATVDMPLTLEVDFNTADKTFDEENLFALSANLYAHEPMPAILQSELVTDKGEPGVGALNLMNIRALAAKRSVAQNSFAAIVSQRTQGNEEVSPFLYSALKEMSNEGIPDDEIKKYLGDKPSYHAQMEMLTKKIYQHPGFYTDLYDKTSNVLRKEAAMQAINLMQKRDMYRSLLRSEVLFSVILETSLMDVQEKVQNEINRLDQDGRTEPLE